MRAVSKKSATQGESHDTTRDHHVDSHIRAVGTVPDRLRIPDVLTGEIGEDHDTPHHSSGDLRDRRNLAHGLSDRAAVEGLIHTLVTPGAR